MTTHIINPHFDALGEAPNWDACGPVAEEVCFASHWSRSPDPARVPVARQRMIHEGLFTPGAGCTINSLNTDMVKNLSLPTTLYPAGTAWTKIYQAMHNAVLVNEPVILNLANAGALKNNESGVHYHFIVLGGIDDNLGYYVADGDQQYNDVVLSYPYVPLYWATYQQLMAAQPFAAIVVHKP